MLLGVFPLCGVATGCPSETIVFSRRIVLGKKKLERPAGVPGSGSKAGGALACRLILERMCVIVNRAPLWVLFAFEKSDFLGAQMHNRFGAIPRTIKRQISASDTEDDGEI